MKRLECVYELIDSKIGVIDVGTDHGRIPIRLAQTGYTGRIIASDIHSAPLQSAVKNAQLSGVEEKILFSVSDGLDHCDPSGIDTVIIAGMGGDLICSILDRAEWTMSDRYQLILQPMTKAEILRFWLCNNGYAIEEERIAFENGRLFPVLSVRFQDRNTTVSDAELFTGLFDKIIEEPFAKDAVSQYMKRIRKKLYGLSDDMSSRTALSFYQAVYQDMEEFYKKTAHGEGE